MQKNLTTLHEQFQKKRLQLTQISQKIDSFVQVYKSKCDSPPIVTDQTDKPNKLNTKNQSKTNNKKQQITNKMQIMNQSIEGIRSQFALLKNDLITYTHMPKEFIKMVIEVPKIYEGFWEKREQQLINIIMSKEEKVLTLQHSLKQKIQQNIKLKQKQAEQQQRIKKLCQQLNQKQTLYEQIQKKKLAEKFKFANIFPYKKEDHERKREYQNQNQNQNQHQQESLENYIQNMEITIRENDDPLFKKITQQESQEQSEDFEREYYKTNVNQQKYVKNKTSRNQLKCLENLNRSTQFRKNKNCQTSFLQQCHRNLNKTEFLVNKNDFWNNLTKNSIQVKQCKKKTKSKSKKSLSQAKQNLENRNLLSGNTNKLTNIQKKILTSKITDFRRLLFAQKGGSYRIGFKI